MAQQHLRSILAFCNAPLFNLLEAYIQYEDGMITPEGEVTNESTREFLETYMQELHGFITRVYMAIPRQAPRQVKRAEAPTRPRSSKPGATRER